MAIRAMDGFVFAHYQMQLPQQISHQIQTPINCIHGAVQIIFAIHQQYAIKRQRMLCVCVHHCTKETELVQMDAFAPIHHTIRAHRIHARMVELALMMVCLVFIVNVHRTRYCHYAQDPHQLAHQIHANLVVRV